jgi:Pectate lyase superfamily protein
VTHTSVTSVAVVAALASLSSCHSSGRSTSPPGIAITITPSSISTPVGGTIEFRATVTGVDAGQSTAVTWSVVPGGGSIDATTGAYVAPMASGNYAVTATSVADSSKKGTATVAVYAPSSTDATGLIPPDRLTVWNPGIPGGIPTATTIRATIDAATYGNGTTDATAAINNAIQAAGDAAAATGVRQVVYLPPGTYRTAATIQMNRSDVVLRGAGPAATKIVSANATWGITLGIVWPTYPQSTAWNVVGSVPKGTKAITLANADAQNIQVGDIVQIDQQDGTYVWLWDGHYRKRQPQSTGSGVDGPFTSVPPDNAVDFTSTSAPGGPWRSVGQQVEVAAKTVGPANTVLTLSGVIHIDFNAARYPQVFHTATRRTASRGNQTGTQYAGIEDLYLTGAANNSILAWNVAYCWIKNVEIDGKLVAGDPSHPGAGGPGIELDHAFRCVVRDSYVHHSRRMLNNAGSYGVLVGDGSSDNLIENNIAIWFDKPLILITSGGGNVIGYNYVDQAIIMGTPWQENAIDGAHNTFSHFDLFEGNWAANIGSDSTHGNAGWMTFFRNYATGRNSIPYDIGGQTGLPYQNLRAAGADAWSREHTFVGNVLNAVDVGSGLTYEATASSHPSGTPVYRLGDNGNGGSGGVWDDGTAASLVYRHANYDNVSNTVVYDPGVSRRDLPNSLYLTAKPQFFGSLTWPWVDPAGTQRVGVLPAKQRFDSMAQ